MGNPGTLELESLWNFHNCGLLSVAAALKLLINCRVSELLYGIRFLDLANRFAKCVSAAALCVILQSQSDMQIRGHT